MSNKFTLFTLLLIIFISGWLYRSSASSYFFQDDWFSLRISDAKNLNDVLTFFIPRSDVIYYRPLGMQVPFFLLSKIFGINHFPFWALTFITHTINIILVYILSSLLLKKRLIALLISFLYATSAVHFLLFYWFAIYAFMAGPTAFFLSFILFILFLNKKKRKYYLLSFIVFIIGLLTNEMVATLPAILFVYSLLLRKKIIFKKLLPFFFSVILLFLLRFIIFTPPVTGLYQLGLGRHIVSNFKTYFFWSFNWSEILTEQMVSIFVFNNKITDQFSFYALFAIVTFTIAVILFYLLPLLFVFRQRVKISFSQIGFGMCWFVIGLSPVLLFSNHKFSYYLPISLVGLLIFSVSLFYSLLRFIFSHNKSFSYFFVVTLIAAWLTISFATVDFNSRIHWAPRRAKLAKALVDAAKIQMASYGNLTNKIYIPLSSENRLALNNQDGLKVIFGRESIVTVYSRELAK
jgi:4-amino-4-deoxy-L-arabinose transferase-like glycosyltransferase